jgi:hypothetical protein
MGSEVDEREPGSLDRVFESVAHALRRFESESGIDALMSAHMVTAAK